jgi:hypothetical protein
VLELEFRENPSKGKRNTARKVLYSSSKMTVVSDRLNLLFSGYVARVTETDFEDNPSNGRGDTVEKVCCSPSNGLFVMD